MATKRNVFTDDLVNLFDRLGDLYHASFVGKWAVENAVSVARERLDEEIEAREDFLGGIFSLGTRLPIPDYLSHEGFVGYHAHRSRVSKDEALFGLAEEMERRLQAQIVCAAFELVEKHLIEVASLSLFQLRGGHGRGRLRLPFAKAEFHARQPKWRMEKHRRLVGSVPYFRAYVGFNYRGGLLKFLEELTSHLAVAQESWQFRRGLLLAQTSYRAVEFCRHKIVHAFGECPEDELRPLGVASKKIVGKMIATSILTGQPTLLPDHKAAGWCIERTAAVALQVHRGVSDAFGMAPWK